MNGVQRQRRLQPNGISIWLRIFSGIANAMQIVRAWILVDLVHTSHRSLRCGCFRTSQNVMAKSILWNAHVVNETTANEIKPVSHVHVDSVNYYPNEHARRLPDWCNSQVLLTDDDAEEHTAKLSLVWVNDRVMTPTLCHYFDAPFLPFHLNHSRIEVVCTNCWDVDPWLTFSHFQHVERGDK